MTTEAMGVTASYTFTHTSGESTSTEEHTGTSHTHQDLSDSTQAATLKISARVANVGGCPAFDVTTVNNIYADIPGSSRMIATVETDGSTKANVIAPHSTYPDQSMRGLVIDRRSDNIFKSELILTVEEYNALMESKGKVVFQTSQSSSNYEKVEELSGEVTVNGDQRWAPYLNEVSQRSALFTLSGDENSITSINIAGSSRNYQVSLDDALRAATNAKYNGEGFFFEYNDKKFDVNKDNFVILANDRLQREIDSGKNFSSIRIQSKDRVDIGLPIYFEKFDGLREGLTTTHITTDLTNNTSKISGSFGKITMPSGLIKTNKMYRLSFDMKSDSSDNKNVELSVGVSEDRSIKRFLIANQWSRYDLEFTSSDHPGFSDNIFFRKEEGWELLIENMRIVSMPQDHSLSKSQYLGSRYSSHKAFIEAISVQMGSECAGLKLYEDGRYKGYKNTTQLPETRGLIDGLRLSPSSNIKLYETDEKFPELRRPIATLTPDRKKYLGVNLSEGHFHCSGHHCTISVPMVQPSAQSGSNVKYSLVPLSRNRGGVEASASNSGKNVNFTLGFTPCPSDEFLILEETTKTAANDSYKSRRYTPAFPLRSIGTPDKLSMYFVNQASTIHEQVSIVYDLNSSGYYIKKEQNKFMALVNGKLSFVDADTLSGIPPDSYLFDFVSGQNHCKVTTKLPNFNGGILHIGRATYTGMSTQ